MTDSQGLKQPSPPDTRQATPTGTVHRSHAGFATGAGTHQAEGGDLNEHGQPCARWQNATGLGCGNVSPFAQWTHGCRRLGSRFEIGTVNIAVTFAIRMGQAGDCMFALTTDRSARGDEVGGHGFS